MNELSSYSNAVRTDTMISDLTIPVADKYALTIRESAEYFNIGVKKLRRLAEDNLGRFAVQSGNRLLIIRPKFEQFLEHSSAV